MSKQGNEDGREWPRMVLTDLFGGESTWSAKGDSNVTDFLTRPKPHII